MEQDSRCVVHDMKRQRSDWQSQTADQYLMILSRTVKSMFMNYTWGRRTFETMSSPLFLLKPHSLLKKSVVCVCSMPLFPWKKLCGKIWNQQLATSSLEFISLVSRPSRIKFLFPVTWPTVIFVPTVRMFPRFVRMCMNACNGTHASGMHKRGTWRVSTCPHVST